MAETIQAMRERRNALVRETRNLLDQNPGASWKDDHQTKYDADMAEIERIDASIGRHEKLMDMEADKAFKDMGGQEHGAPAASGAQKLYAKWLRNGDRGLNQDEWAQIRAAMSGNPDENPEQGGYTVPKETATRLLEALEYQSPMRQAAEVIKTDRGGDLSFPTTDGTQEEGEIVPENQAASEEDIEFGIRTLKTYKFSSKVVTVPFELLQDSAIDVEALVNRRLEERLGRITNRMFTTGSGVGQPLGIATGAAVGKQGAVGSVPVFTYDDLVDLEHSVDPAYRMNAKWMLHDHALASLRKVKDNDGRPIFVPALGDGTPGGVPARLLNRDVVINQHLAAPAPGSRSVLFGDFKKYLIRDVMAVTLFRFADSAYIKRGQIGFLAWMRTGGTLLDIGGAVKAFQHGAAE